MQTKRANQSNENLYEIIKSNVSIRLLCNGFVLAVAPSTSRLKFMATEFSLQTSTVVAVVMVAAARRSATTNHYLPVPNLHIFNQLFFPFVRVSTIQAHWRMACRKPNDKIPSTARFDFFKIVLWFERIDSQ